MKWAAFFFAIMTAASVSANLDLHTRTFLGHFEATPAEVAKHQQGLATLMQTVTESTEEFRQVHLGWLRSCGIGLLYGYVSKYSTLSSEERQSFIKSHATCGTPPQVDDVRITSCEIFANRYLAKGFVATGQADVYKRIDRFLNDNGRDGLALTFALRKLGWKIVYWNTDVNQVPPLPSDRTLVGLTSDDHILDTRTALHKHVYYGVPIDSFMINFWPLPSGNTIKDEVALRALSRVPYYVGISHAGFHVWTGSYGNVTESHSFFDPNSDRNIQIGEFHPPLASPTGREVEYQGKKQMFYYYSGIIAVPPGPWLWF